jgi:hypothetical protein
MQKQLQAPNILQREDLKSFGNATGPCVSLYFADHDPREKTRQDEVRLRNATDQAAQRLKEIGFDKAAIAELLDPIRALASDMGPWHIEGNSFAVFRSPGIFRVFRPMHKMDEISVVGEHFYVLPVLRMLDAERHFYILALSQKNIRLLKCTEFSSEEIALPEAMPRSLEQWLNTRPPNSNEENMPSRTEPGATLGSFTSGTDRDRKDEHLMNFYRAVDRHIQDCVRGETAPLVLAGVEYEVHAYSRIAAYPHVAPSSVFGAPDSLKGGELHQRALPAALESFTQPRAKALEQFEKFGPERRAAGVLDCVRAAHQAKVAHLFVADQGRAMGVFNPDTMEAKLDEGTHCEDLMNLAALRTILGGGDVWLMRPEQIPGKAQVAAVLRY